VDWIHIFKDRDRLRALVDTVLRLKSLMNDGKFRDQLSVLLASQEGPCSTEFATLWVIFRIRFDFYKKLKLSHYTTRSAWGEEVQLLLILDLGTKWG
jgi:hypothetical protein